MLTVEGFSVGRRKRVCTRTRFELLPARALHYASLFARIFRYSKRRGGIRVPESIQAVIPAA